jgi:hypothetical protein
VLEPDQAGQVGQAPEFGQADPIEIARVTRGNVVVDACQGISVGGWRAAGWRVSSLTGSAA